MSGWECIFPKWFFPKFSCLKCIFQNCISQNCISEKCISQKCIFQNCISQRCISLECISLKCISEKCVLLPALWQPIRSTIPSQRRKFDSRSAAKHRFYFHHSTHSFDFHSVLKVFNAHKIDLDVVRLNWHTEMELKVIKTALTREWLSWPRKC